MAADEALQCAMAGGDYEILSRALEAHRGAANEVALQQARAERDRLAKKRKKESQRLRKAHAGAMSSLPELQALSKAGDASALRKGVEAAASHLGVLPALDVEVTVAQARLDDLAIRSASAATEAEGQAVELTLADLTGALPPPTLDSPPPKAPCTIPTQRLMHLEAAVSRCSISPPPLLCTRSGNERLCRPK